MNDRLSAFIGPRLRRRRITIRKTLREVADETGLTPSFLSQVERGKVSLSLNSLHTIAQALDIPVLYLLADDISSREIHHPSTSGGDPSQKEFSPVVQREERSKVFFPVSGVTLELMVPSLGRKMAAFKGRLSPGMVHITTQLREPTEEFLYVTQGELLVELQDARFIVHADESIYFEGEKLVRMVCMSENEDAAWVVVITPPVY